MIQVKYYSTNCVTSRLTPKLFSRGSLKTFIHTVHLLQKQTDLGQLPVSDVLYRWGPYLSSCERQSLVTFYQRVTTLYLSCVRLLLLEGGPGSPSCLLGGKHSVSWGFEDMLPTPDNSAGGAESKGKVETLVWSASECLKTQKIWIIGHSRCSSSTWLWWVISSSLACRL